jgi:hypothetical protein
VDSPHGNRTGGFGSRRFEILTDVIPIEARGQETHPLVVGCAAEDIADNVAAAVGSQTNDGETGKNWENILRCSVIMCVG